MGREILEVLRHNVGFDEPGLWVNYAMRRGFRKTKAAAVTHCPDCDAPAGSVLGQFIHYSTLVKLRVCPCDLIWADAHLDEEVIRNHFEFTYKDRKYFEIQRGAIFDHLVRLIDSLVPKGGRVIDIGGGCGDLMGKLVTRRHDLDITVQDLSPTSLAEAERRFGFATTGGFLSQLSPHLGTFDVVVASDILYYERDLKRAWQTLSRLVRAGGAAVLRVPDRFASIRFFQKLLGSPNGLRRRKQTWILGFNPEHLFLFRRRYLFRRFREIGFGRVAALPSPMLGGQATALVRQGCFRLALAMHRLTGHRAITSPSMIVVATERRG